MRHQIREKQNWPHSSVLASRTTKIKCTMHREQLRGSIIETAYCTFAIRFEKNHKKKKKKAEKPITITFHRPTPAREMRGIRLDFFLNLLTLMNALMVVERVLQTGFAPIVRKRSRTYSNSPILRTKMRAASLHPGDTVDVELLQFSPSSSFLLSSSTRCKESHAGILTLPFPLLDVHEAPPRLQLSPTNATIGSHPFTVHRMAARHHFRPRAGSLPVCDRQESAVSAANAGRRS